MARSFYLQRGTTVFELPEGYDQFYISAHIDPVTTIARYSFPGDSILYDLDSLCVDLYDTFRDCVFESPKEYYPWEAETISSAILICQRSNWKNAFQHPYRKGC